MSDFSLFSLFTAGLACLVPLTAAYTQPKGAEPKGNPISLPGLGSIVPVGKPFTVTWDPTTQGTVTLVLLKGPSTNALPQYALVENYPNNGSYVWTPATNLAPSDASTPAQGYGIQLIVDATGQYQYTTQFGISNAQYQSGQSSSQSPPTYGQTSSAPTPTGYSHSQTTAPPAYSTPSGLPKPTWYTKPTSSATHNTTVVAPTYGGETPTFSTSYSTPSASANTTVPGTPFTGSASTLASSFAGLVFAAGVAVFVL